MRYSLLGSQTMGYDWAQNTYDLKQRIHLETLHDLMQVGKVAGKLNLFT